MTHIKEKLNFKEAFTQARQYTDMQNYDLCMTILRDLVDQGYSCPLEWERFKPLEEMEGYLELSEKNDQLRKKMVEQAEFKYEVHLPQGYTEEKEFPLFIALHGDGDNIEEFSQYWLPEFFLKQGFIIVYLQSSQAIFYQGFAWLKRVYDLKGNEEWLQSPDIYRISSTSCLIKKCYQEAADEIKEAYNSILEQYAVNTDQVVVGGFSGGATAAIDLTMSEIIPIKGFISLSPQRPVSFTEDNVKKAVERGVKGVLLEGEEELPVAEQEEMVNLARENGFDLNYYINQGIGHWYPEDLEEKLEQALNFISVS